MDHDFKQNPIIEFSIKNKLLVFVGIIALVVAGGFVTKNLALDAVPDITNNQVQVVTVATALAPQEVEQYITQPLERVLTNIAGVHEIRSISRFGLSVITVVFHEGTDTYRARQIVSEQIGLAEGDLPDGFSPELMPVTTGLGEIFQYTLQVDEAYKGQYDITELRTIQDWIVKRQLSGIPGIVEISSFGGYLKQYEVAVNPDQLRGFNLSLTDVFDALARNNQNSGGSYIEKGSNAWYIRTEGVAKTKADIENIVVTHVDEVPILVRDIARVGYGFAPRFGAMTANGLGETVGGITLMLKGASSSRTIKAVHAKMEAVQKTLPKGITIVPYLDRSELVSKTIHTVSKNLLEGAIIVVLVLILLLGNWRAGFIVASVIPLSMLFAFICMNALGVSANLMSLGAIDFGIVVDGAVIVVEAILHKLHHQHKGTSVSKEGMDNLVMRASSQIYTSAVFGVLIILVVFMPIMFLTGIEGKMFRPMAQTVSFAVLGAMILSITYVPVMASLFLKRDVNPQMTLADRFVYFLQSIYKKQLKRALDRPYWVVGTALLSLVATIIVFSRLGGEFIPTLEEGDLAVQMTIKPGSALSESVHTSTLTEKLLLDSFPEVKQVISKIGTAEVPTDPMAIEDSDIMISMKPQEEWTSAHSRDEMVSKMKALLERHISWAGFEFSQPIQLRFNELMTGAKTDIAIKIFGEDLEVLAQLAAKSAKIVESIPGAGDIRVEQTEGLPQLMVKFDEMQVARYGLNVVDLNAIVRTAFAGEKSGVIYEGERKFDLVVRLDSQSRQNIDLASLTVQLPDGGVLPLSEVATLSFEDGPMLVSREEARRLVKVGINVRNRDVQSLITEISQKLDAQLDLPPGYYIKYGGQFENLIAAKKRLQVVVPIALALILLLLYFAFRSMKYALIIFTAVPLSAIGGVFALTLRGMPFSISAGVGFIALFGVAVLNGLVLVSFLNELRKMDATQKLKDIIIEGASVRLRPVIMTAAVAALGFLPMAISTSAGAEVQKPLATVVIGGLISATLLTLIVLPVVYLLTHQAFVWPKKIKSATVIGLMMLLGGTQGLWAQTDSPELLKAIDYVLVQHPGVKQLGLQVEADEALKQQTKQFGPTVFSVQTGQINASNFDYWAQIDQPLGQIGMPKQRLALAESMVNRSTRDLENYRRILKQEIRSAWYSYQYVGAKMDLLTQTENRYVDFVQKIKLQVQTGTSSRLDLALAELQLASVAQSKLDMQQQLLEAKTALNLWLPDTLMPDNRNVEYAQLRLLYTEGMALSPSLMQVQEASVLVAQNEFNMVKAQQKPAISVGVFQQQLEGKSGFVGAAVEVSVPIWGNNLKSKLRRSELEIEMAKQALDMTEIQLDNARSLKYESLQLVDAQIKAFEAQVNNQVDFLESSANLAIQSGESDFATLIQALATSTNLRLQYLELVHRYNSLLVEYTYLVE